MRKVKKWGREFRSVLIMLKQYVHVWLVRNMPHNCLSMVLVLVCLYPVIQWNGIVTGVSDAQHTMYNTLDRYS